MKRVTSQACLQTFGLLVYNQGYFGDWGFGYSPCSNLPLLQLVLATETTCHHAQFRHPFKESHGLPNPLSCTKPPHQSKLTLWAFYLPKFWQELQRVQLLGRAFCPSLSQSSGQPFYQISGASLISAAF